MPSAPDHTASSFSIFVSYASADRAPARRLGATLAAAGLDVWFDEEDLAGGEAWDAKIRQQIRACTYFLPVISTTTETRSEGYFRREWRLAVERTLDLADDVTFLVPIAIDDTPEYRARVPEKFTTVQWLRCPGGAETPQLAALARRLAAGPTAAPASTAGRRAMPPKAASAARPDAAASPLRPFPVFPGFPAPGHRGRFVYDLVVWAGHLVAALWVRLPRWLRLIAMVVIVFKVINVVFVARRPDRDESPRTTAPTGAKTIAESARRGGGHSDLAEKIIAAAGTAIDRFQSGRPLAVVAFAATDASLEAPALKAFTALHAQLVHDGHEDQVSVGAMALPPTHTAAEVVARAAVLQCRWFLTGVARPADDDNFTLEVRLYEPTAGKAIWQTTRTAARRDAATLGRTLAGELLEHIDLDAPPPPNGAPAQPPSTPPK